jgi:hypothetical protein
MDMSQTPKVPRADKRPDPITLSAGRRRVFGLLRAASQMQMAAKRARNTRAGDAEMRVEPVGKGKVLFRKRPKPAPAPAAVSPDWDSRADVFDFKL